MIRINKITSQLVRLFQQNLVLSLTAVGLWRGWLEALRYIHVSGDTSWYRWDGGWYLNIINGGYHYFKDAQSNVAFFPLFPKTVKLLADITSWQPGKIGLVLNFLLVLGSCFVAVKLVEFFSKGKNNLLLKKILCLAAILLFPTSFYLAAFYADPMLVFLATAGIYLSFTKRHRFSLALSALATAVKFMGIVVLPVQMLIYLQDRGFTKKNVLKSIGFGALGLAGLIAFMVYLQIHLGDGLVFLKAEKLWNRTTDFFVISVGKEYLDIARNLFNPLMPRIGTFGRLFNGFIPFMALGMVYYFAKKRVYWLALFIALVVGVPLLSGSLTSLSRYILTAVPLTVAYVIAKIDLDKKYVNAALVVLILLSGLVMSVLCHYFLVGNAFIA